MGEVQRQVSKHVLASDPHMIGHVGFENPPATSLIRVSARERKVSRLSASFFGSLFFMA